MSGLVETSVLKVKVKELLVEHSETTFHDPEKPLTRTDTIEHEILTSGRPVRIPPRRVAPRRRKIVEDKIFKMEKEETITKSSGPWCSPIVLVRKKDGTIHFCGDYRKLNDATHTGAKYFCSIDLGSGYWQVQDGEEKVIIYGSKASSGSQ